MYLSARDIPRQKPIGRYSFSLSPKKNTIPRLAVCVSVGMYLYYIQAASVNALPLPFQFVEERKSSNSIATINTQVGPGDVARRIREEKDHRPNEIVWVAHLALWNQGCPLVFEIWFVV